MEYNEATYLLINDGHDYINGSRQTPLNWWGGFSVNLGQATDERHAWGNVLRRDFTGGMTLVNPPGSSAQTVSLPTAMQTTTGATVTSVTLAPASGAVLTGAGTTAPTPASTEGSAPAPTQTTLETTPVSSSPAPPRHGNQSPHGTKTSSPTGHASVDAQTSTRPHHRRAAQAHRRGRSANRQAGGRRRSRAALTRVSGAVLHATQGKVRVKLEVRRRGRWVVAKSLSLRVSAAGRFLRLLRLRDGGFYRLAARYMGTSSYAASSSRVDTLVARIH
jgi:hypothetical protein